MHDLEATYMLPYFICIIIPLSISLALSIFIHCIWRHFLEFKQRCKWKQITQFLSLHIFKFCQKPRPWSLEMIGTESSNRRGRVRKSASEVAEFLAPLWLGHTLTNRQHRQVITHKKHCNRWLEGDLHQEPKLFLIDDHSEVNQYFLYK